MTQKAKKPQGPRLHIEMASVPWKKIRGLTPRLKRAAALTLASLPVSLLPAARGAELTLLLTTDKAVQTLNLDFRGKDAPTNVLSFPAFERQDLVKIGKKEETLYVGDLAMAYHFTAKEAKVQHKDLLDHVTHLMIHGILHLFGYDHITSGQAARMEKLEKELMASMGLLDPYAPDIT